MPLPQALIDRMNVRVLDESNVDGIVARGCILAFFAGDPVQRPEAIDLAVVFPELLKAFAGRLEGALVAREAEQALGARFAVDVTPGLALIRDGATIGVVSRIRDWAEYLEKIEGFLDPAAAPLAPRGPRVAFTFSQKEVEA